MRAIRSLLFAALASAVLAACAVTDHSQGEATLARDAQWALLPIANHTEVPQAGLRAEAIAEGVLRSRGVAKLLHYPSALNPDTLLEASERKAQADAQKWARDAGARYALTGAVDEWRYKVGIDGEPAVGLALQIIDLNSGAVLWSGVGAKSGWSREALAAVAQKLMRELLDSARLQ
ncbi:MAG: penicillin-binding protein activator LpoB [Burkholderiales bacterium]|nr:penicillin-binding protein activator LpoB [Burkholderiales bacterium]